MPFFRVDTDEKYPDYVLSSGLPSFYPRGLIRTVGEWFYYTEAPVELTEEEAKRWSDAVTAVYEMEELIETRRQEARWKKRGIAVIFRLVGRLHEE